MILSQEAGDGEDGAPLTNGFHEDDAPARIPRPSSAKGARRRPEPPNAADAGTSFSCITPNIKLYDSSLVA